MDLWIIRALLFAAILVSGYFVRPFGQNLLPRLRLALYSLCHPPRGNADSQALTEDTAGSRCGIHPRDHGCEPDQHRDRAHEPECADRDLCPTPGPYPDDVCGIDFRSEQGEYLDLSSFGGFFTDSSVRKWCKVLDTSVIIDGRVADICKTGFLEGTLVVRILSCGNCSRSQTAPIPRSETRAPRPGRPGEDQVGSGRCRPDCGERLPGRQRG